MTTQTPQANQPEQTRKDLEVSLIAKAWTNEAFKQQLLNNPRAAVEQELGEQLPEGMNVQIIQEPANTLYIVLPTKPESSDELSGGLSDEELEAVAGGAIGTAALTVMVPVYGVAPWRPIPGSNKW